MEFYKLSLAESASPEKQVVELILSALRFCTPQQLFDEMFALICSTTELSIEKKLSIRIVASELLKYDFSAFNLDAVLNYILYGDFQSIGLEFDSSMVFTEHERLGIFLALIASAKSVIVTETQKLQIQANTVINIDPYSE